MDALSWIAVAVIAVAAILGLGELTPARSRAGHLRSTVTALLVIGMAVVVVTGLGDGSVKETVFDGWLDQVVDAIDGTSDEEERLAHQQEGLIYSPHLA